MPKRSNKLLRPVIAALAMASFFVLGAGCGNDTGNTPADTSCFDYASFSGASPAVSFKTDVLPIFRQSCGVGGAACHGQQSGIKSHPFLGPAKSDPDPTQADIDVIFAQNVGVFATEATMTMLVDPGHPETSFLMHKMDGTQETCGDAKCETSCKTSMPLGQDILPADTRNTVRRWIAQGAKND